MTDGFYTSSSEESEDKQEDVENTELKRQSSMGEDITRYPRHGRHGGWYPKLDIDPIESGVGMPEHIEITHGMSSLAITEQLSALSLHGPVYRSVIR